MTNIEPNTPVGQLVAERPNRSKVFEKIGIDYCCGGKQSLLDVCKKQGLDITVVLNDLANIDDVDNSETDWSKTSISELVDHIIDAYHIKLRNDLPRLIGLAEKVANVHGANHPELKQLELVLRRFTVDLHRHMDKEEMILFPLCKELEASKKVHAFHCGSIANPINVMEYEHTVAGNDLETLASLTNKYTPPTDACNSFRALLAGLEELEGQMHQHVHLENNILFPRAKELEAASQH